MKLWKWEQENLSSVVHSIRTAIAATLSLAVARLLGLSEAYWAGDRNARSDAINSQSDSLDFR